MTRLYKYPPSPVSVTVPPVQAIINGVPTPIESDDSNPSNNKPLPSGVYYKHNGNNIPVEVDTVTPANTRPLPVELYGAGTTVNLTAGDINVQLDHTGASFDSTRIGDGTDLLAINADGSINTVGPLTDAQLRASAVPVSGPLTDTELRASAVPVSAASLPLPTGASTEAKQDNQITELQAIKTAVQLIDDAIGTDGTPKPSKVMVVAGVDGAGDTQELRTNTAGELLVNISTSGGGMATETTLAALNAKANNDYGAAAGALRTAAQLGNASGQADFNSGSDSSQTIRVSANIKRSGNELSYNAGVVDANTLRVTLPTDQAAIAVSGPLTDAQLRAAAVPVSASSLPLPTGAATEAKQDSIVSEVIAAGNKQLVPFAFDEIEVTYVGTTTDVNTVVYKQASSTVATLTLGYDGDGRLNSVVRS